MYRFRLYLVGNTVAATKKIEDLKKDLSSVLGDRFELEVLDILTNSAQAQADNIYATPTIIRMEPQPVLKVVGNFNSKQVLVKALGLKDTPS
ncbi:MAG: hypothetical protein OEY59_10555 [Deltaproteobacteria bacterium]|nr:hypothetical protein [Deltaproteobacteria bacterium]